MQISTDINTECELFEKTRPIAQLSKHTGARPAPAARSALGAHPGTPISVQWEQPRSDDRPLHLCRHVTQKAALALLFKRTWGELSLQIQSIQPCSFEIPQQCSRTCAGAVRLAKPCYIDYRRRDVKICRGGTSAPHGRDGSKRLT